MVRNRAFGVIRSAAVAICVIAWCSPPAWPPVIPDAKLTPGDVLNVSAKDVCIPGYAKRARDVPQSEKDAVYREYGILSRKPGEYEIDHDVSLELGGSDKIANLWPQSYVTKPWNAHVKDRLEDRLHAEVCKGAVTLAAAQKAIEGDWRPAYVARFGQPK